ncbi:MAG: hypothetical protein J3Q66DRAFT_405515 [Benniella sp.]|nr:MAG: hypothetical protein J3Q66DRAFT_405515 [Benniella sp.]
MLNRSNPPLPTDPPAATWRFKDSMLPVSMGHTTSLTSQAFLLDLSVSCTGHVYGIPPTSPVYNDAYSGDVAVIIITVIEALSAAILTTLFVYIGIPKRTHHKLAIRFTRYSKSS